MENVTDALYIAFGVLIFVIALSVGISLFSQARSTSEVLINNIDKAEYVVLDDDAETSRRVGIETIIPSLYRAFKENYSVRFIDENGKPMTIFKIKTNYGTISTNVLDISANGTNDRYGQYKIIIGNHIQARNFVDWLVSGKPNEEFSISTTSYSLQNKNLYGIIKGKIENGYVFEETLGLYYEEDQLSDNNNNIKEESFATATKDVNKQERRVITYTATKTTNN